MAKQLLVELVDDIDQSVLDAGGESIRFSVDGVDFEIDLNSKHARRFRKELGRYIAHAKKAGRATRSTTASSRSPRRDPAQLRVIREWARSNGHDISDRGRISADIEAAFTSAH